MFVSAETNQGLLFQTYLRLFDFQKMRLLRALAHGYAGARNDGSLLAKLWFVSSP